MAGLIMLAIALAFFIDEPLRRHVEQEINSRLKGYTVRIGKLDLRPLSFSVGLYDVTILQDANPDPPIMHVPNIEASMQWRALLSGRVVSDVLIERPHAHINLKQIRDEAADDVPVQERGWQEALQAVSPLKVNEVQVIDAEFTYIDAGPFRPLHVRQLQFRAENIRNIHSEERVYPSDISLEGIIFDSGKISMNGHADFLAEPHMGIKAQFALENMELDYFKPIVSRHNIAVRDGTLSGAGEIEYAPTIKVVHLQSAAIQGVHLDYIHTAQTAPVEREAAQKVQEKAQEVSNAPGILLRADQLSIVRSDIGFVNKAARPNYRVFLAPIEVHLTNFSNQFTEGPAVAKVTGKFMGSGQTVVGATFLPETTGPNFALAASIENTQMRTLNNLLRAHGNFDVVNGFFSVYSEFRVKDRTVRGYVKPLVREMDVYDPSQDREKNLFQKIYEGLVGGVSKLLENMPREEVATKADISGPIENPQASTWQVLVSLIQNAFFQSILPGFESDLRRSGR
jgi:hypothetical protein